MVAQTSYSILQGSYYEGQIVDLSPRDVVTKVVETAAGIGMGRAVSRGTNEDQVTLGGDGTFFGITVRELTRESARSTSDVTYSQRESAAIIRYGYVAVRLAAGGTPGNAILYNDTTGVINVGTASAGETQITGATLETTTAAGNIGVIRLQQ